MLSRPYCTWLIAISASLLIACTQALVAPCGIRVLDGSSFSNHHKLCLPIPARRGYATPWRDVTSRITMSEIAAFPRNLHLVRQDEALPSNFPYFFRLVAVCVVCIRKMQAVVQNMFTRMFQLQAANHLSARTLVMVQLMLLALFGAPRPSNAAVMDRPYGPRQEHGQLYESSHHSHQRLDLESMDVITQPSRQGLVLAKKLLKGTVGVILVLPVAVSQSTAIKSSA
jgi:hypothetical protein